MVAYSASGKRTQKMFAVFAKAKAWAKQIGWLVADVNAAFKAQAKKDGKDPPRRTQ